MSVDEAVHSISPVPVPDSVKASPPRRRRWALALGAAASATALGLGRSKPTQAATGDPLILGHDNTAADPTGLRPAPGSSPNEVFTVVANDGSAVVANAESSQHPAILASNLGLPNERRGGTAIEGRGSAILGVGVRGTAGEAGGIGVVGTGGSGGVVGSAGTDGTGVSGTGLTGVFARGGLYGVRAFSGGPGIWATGDPGGLFSSSAQGGFGLGVSGKASFSTVGSGTLQTRSDAATIANPAVTATSHISVTLTGDPGDATTIQWVERQPTVGFTVHLTHRTRVDVPFTYFIVEPQL